jgi:uncharacterized membrane protein YoaK (UPF0700 family)
MAFIFATLKVVPYSYPQPLDKATIHRQWKHLLPGAMALCGTAGYVNSVVLGFFNTPVSHMSGAVSHLGVNIAEGHVIDSFGSLLIICGFIIGSMLAGILIGATKLGPSRRYGGVMMLEGGLLLASMSLLLQKSLYGPMLAACACGLQNAMSSSYCGLAIRTTHVSGLVTDLGVMIGHWIRHQKIAYWKLRFLLMMLASFGGGGILGAYLDMVYGPLCLLVPSIGCLVAGALFWKVVQNRSGAEEEGSNVDYNSERIGDV